eukprot:TRINITY_DN5012_c0_g1_i1.p1 TRINITY_DN5012_c0_g1~~TRINITY_DN5012_c0_g1_i1.p1  ORF type:complete len:329 (+),score=25.00 TRINITY_DN5012_c0_g1_i1:629-1615(+)
MGRGPTVEQCEFSFAGDDFINVHNTICMAWRNLGANKWLAVDPDSNNTLSKVKVGDTLKFYKLDELNFLGESQVTDIRYISDPAITTEANKIPSVLAQKGTIVRDFGASVFQITFDKDVTTLGVAEYDLVQFDKFCGADAVIRNNYFHDGHVTGMKLKSIGAVVESNTFERTASWDIGIFAEQYYFEGSLGIRDIYVYNNTMVKSCYKYIASDIGFVQGAITVQIGASNSGDFYNVKAIQYSNITISNNMIGQSSTTGITVKNARDVLIQNNVIQDPAFMSEGYAFYFDSAQNITVDCYKVSVNTNKYRGLLGYGPNINKDTVTVKTC